MRERNNRMILNNKDKNAIELRLKLIEIQDEWDRMEQMSCKPSFKKVPNDYVFDENRSVKWNNGQVEQNHLQYENEVKRLNTAKNKTRDEIYTKIYKTIQKEIGKGISLEQTKKIWSFVNDYSKSNNQRITMLAQMIELCKDIRQKPKEKQQEDDYERD